MICSMEKNNSAETVLEKDLKADLLDKEFKTTDETFKELKEDVEKVKKTMYKQSRNIKKRQKT